MQRSISTLFVVLFLFLIACTPDTIINGYSVNQRPVIQVLSPTNSWVGTNYCISFAATDVDGTNCTVYLQIGNGPVSNYPGFVTNTIWFSNQPPGYPPSLTLYARDDRGKYSLTNHVDYSVSVPGFTEINTGTLAGLKNFSSIALGDLDGNGTPDLILTDISTSKIYQNDGSGTFAEIYPGSLPIGIDGAIALGDLDGDGDLDLVFVGHFWDNNRAYRNDGSGALTGYINTLPQTIEEGSIALGDLDNDGDLDLILTGHEIGFVSKIFMNDGNGVFTITNTGNLLGVAHSSIALGDLDGDGHLDLILTGDVITTRVSKIYRNDGSGTFSEIGSGTLNDVFYSAIALGDLDGDGDLDLILTGSSPSGNISIIYQNDGNGGFTEINPGSLTGVSHSSIALGDLDGDGDLDLILTGYGPSGVVSKIYQNDGTGGFTEINPGSLTGVSYSSIALGDLDGDGDLDLILTGYTGSVAISKIYRNNWNRGGCVPYAVPKPAMH